MYNAHLTLSGRRHEIHRGPSCSGGRYCFSHPHVVCASRPDGCSSAAHTAGGHPPLADGLSHVEQVNVNFSPVDGAPPTVEHSKSVKVSSSYIVRLATGFFQSWHNADARRYVIPISGLAEVEVAGGEKISVQPGRIYLAEDLTGKGHTFRVVSADDWVALFVEFAQ